MRITVRVSARADREATTAARWWRRNRDATRLFEQEYESALERLEKSPGIPPIVMRRKGEPIRRVRLPRTRYHLYYVYDVDRSDVLVVAIWSSRRGRGPFGQ